MPPSQEAEFFIRQDFARVFFDFDISSNEPSIPIKAPPRARNRPVIIPATNNAKANNTIPFLTLPLELRL